MCPGFQDGVAECNDKGVATKCKDEGVDGARFSLVDSTKSDGSASKICSRCGRFAQSCDKDGNDLECLEDPTKYKREAFKETVKGVTKCRYCYESMVRSTLNGCKKCTSFDKCDECITTDDNELTMKDGKCECENSA